jgi:hypothetical protein
MHMGRTGRNYTCEGARGFEVFENVDCGELGCNAGCNNTHYLRVILGEQGCYHSVLSQEALPTFQQIQHEIDQNRPVPCRVQWVPDTQGGHFILISGWEVGADGARRVHILDPARNDGSNAIVKIKMDYEELEAGYLGTLGYGYINFSYRVA